MLYQPPLELGSRHVTGAPPTRGTLPVKTEQKEAATTWAAHPGDGGDGGTGVWELLEGQFPCLGPAWAA